MSGPPPPLSDRVALVTGVSRRVGIGSALSERLLEMGASVHLLNTAAGSQATATLADTLADRGITVNTVNPGPTDTGYASPDAHAAVTAQMPAGRWGRPRDAAHLIGWLCTDEAAWVTGQVINSEGGFRRG